MVSVGLRPGNRWRVVREAGHAEVPVRELDSTTANRSSSTTDGSIPMTNLGKVMTIKLAQDAIPAAGYSLYYS